MELCYIVDSYNQQGMLDKRLQKDLESRISALVDVQPRVSLRELGTVTNIMCKTRVFSREFQKQIERQIIERLEELVLQTDVLYFLGKTFEESGLVSTETLKILKREYAKIKEREKTFQ